MRGNESFERVGIVGTGEIGRRIGSLLNRTGRKVVGFDISEKATKAAVDAGVEPMSSLAELSKRADLVITCVTDGSALRAVACGHNGLENHLPAGIPVIDTTSAEPWISRDVATALGRRDIPFLDAPVSGGVPAAEAGRLNFMVGGDASLLKRLLPLLNLLGPVVTHVGPVGSGHTIKAINMLVLASSMLSTAELIAICTDAYRDRMRLVTDLDAGPGASYSTRVHFPRFILPENFASGFTFDLMLKDLAIGIELANRLNVPLFLQRSTFEAYRSAECMGMRGKDNTIMAKLPTHVEQSKVPLISPKISGLVAVGFNTIIAAEAMALGAAAGLAPEPIREVVSSGSGDSFAMRNVVGPRLKNQLSGIDLHSVVEAHEAVLSLAFSKRLPAPLISQSRALNVAALRSSHDDPDASSMLRLVWHWAGQNVARC